jgi:hypothetical protein
MLPLSLGRLAVAGITLASAARSLGTLCADLLDAGISDTDNTKSLAGEIGKKQKGHTHLPRQQARQLPVRHPDRQWLPEAS